MSKRQCAICGRSSHLTAMNHVVRELRAAGVSLAVPDSGWAHPECARVARTEAGLPLHRTTAPIDYDGHNP